MRLPDPSRRLLLFIFSAVFIVVAFGQLPGDKLFLRELQNTGHTLLFGLLTYMALWLAHNASRDNLHPYYSYLFVGSACLFIAITTECVQWLTGRGFSYTDIARDLGGITVAVGLYSIHDRLNGSIRVIRSATLRAVIFMLVCGLVIAALHPLGSLALDLHARKQAFPAIIDMRAEWAGSFISLQQAVLDIDPDADTCGPVMNDSLAGLRLLPARYTGVSVIEPYPDWRSYRYLTFTLFSNRPEPFELVLRIHDRLHNNDYSDRFNRKLKVFYGENRYRILLTEVMNAADGRELDMANIAGIILFAENITDPLEFCAGPIRLEQ